MRKRLLVPALLAVVLIAAVVAAGSQAMTQGDDGDAERLASLTG